MRRSYCHQNCRLSPLLKQLSIEPITGPRLRVGRISGGSMTYPRFGLGFPMFKTRCDQERLLRLYINMSTGHQVLLHIAESCEGTSNESRACELKGEYAVEYIVRIERRHPPFCCHLSPTHLSLPEASSLRKALFREIRCGSSMGKPLRTRKPMASKTYEMRMYLIGSAYRRYYVRR
jgi:hypothetical protein